MKLLPLSKIRDDGGTQTRAELRADAIDDYAEAMRLGAKFPPVDVFLDKAGNYWLSDGFHRYQAACKAELERLAANIHKGELRDAIWFALSANTANGLRRTNPDKRRCVEIALADKQWSKMSDRAIADHVGVSNVMVSGIRSELLTVNNCEPPKRTGRDGKKYSATKPKRKPEPKPEPESIDHDEPAAAVSDDDPRNALRESARQASWTLFHALDALGIGDRWQAAFKKIRDEIKAA